VFGHPIFGFWDEDARKITFVRQHPAGPTSYQVYTGFLFKPVYTLNTGQAGNTYSMLAGSFEAFIGTGANAQRILYGWHAQFVR
jgi:hypothetical protein